MRRHSYGVDGNERDHKRLVKDYALCGGDANDIISMGSGDDAKRDSG